MKSRYILCRPDVRERALEAVRQAPEGYVVTIGEPTRSLEQNAALWAILTDISKQVEWYGKILTPDDWKNVFTSSLRKLEVVPNLEGTGFVALGQSTSAMTKREFGDLLDLIGAFCAEKGVVFEDELSRIFSEKAA